MREFAQLNLIFCACFKRQSVILLTPNIFLACLAVSQISSLFIFIFTFFYIYNCDSTLTIRSKSIRSCSLFAVLLAPAPSIIICSIISPWHLDIVSKIRNKSHAQYNKLNIYRFLVIFLYFLMICSRLKAR